MRQVTGSVASPPALSSVAIRVPAADGSPSTPLSVAAQLQLIPPIAPTEHVGPARPFFAACGETRCGSMARKAVFQAYASVAQANGATWRVNGKWTEFYARQTRIAALAECDLSTVKRETRALIQAGRLIRIQTARGRIPHAYQVVPEGWGPIARVAPLTPARGATQAPRRPPGRTARQLTVTPLNSVERSHRPPNRALEEPSTASTAAAGVLPAVPKGEQQSKGQQQQQRINGMLASCEISARELAGGLRYRGPSDNGSWNGDAPPGGHAGVHRRPESAYRRSGHAPVQVGGRGDAFASRHDRDVA